LTWTSWFVWKRNYENSHG